ncbi:hypothetical protein L228DRAFT_250953 [Xylona heveae TC161]|uniref:Uncharacterized protein n=1 Tax=Xylona heveae (strain CBS 132557 / TC161) TaxID=1328760 RepID=A0A164ZQ29_XYLHT|nr:hypothetical protein L228DRAFT_250953 [Xylona heveae TC161]KZF19363.1 hypothetical protein L228DRAFT_250953 [Xylona heveae TC161]
MHAVVTALEPSLKGTPTAITLQPSQPPSSACGRTSRSDQCPQMKHYQHDLWGESLSTVKYST